MSETVAAYLKRLRRRGKNSSTLLLALIVAVSVVLTPFTPINAASCTLQGNTITVSCDFAPGTYYYNGTFTVDNLVTVTAGSASSPGLVTIIADDFDIDGTISANGLGSAGGAGSCPGTAGSTGSGACHGGGGGRSSGGVTGGTASYGSALQPTTIGSGGGDDTGTGGTQSGAGGGAIKLATWSSTGTLSFGTLGAITADGAGGSSIEAGGGSGGSVWIDVGTLTAQFGIITANGGAGFGSGTAGGGGGGGGRVAVNYHTISGIFGMSSQAFGGNRGSTTSLAAQVGGAGSVSLWDKDTTNPDLRIENNNQFDSPISRQTAGDDYTVSDLYIRNGAQYLIRPGDSLTVESGGDFLGGSAAGRQPKLWIQGTFNAPSEAMSVVGLDIHQNGTIGTLKYLTFDNGYYGIEPSSALFSAGRGNRLEGLTLSGTNQTILSATGTGVFHVDTFQAKSGALATHATNTTSHLHSLSISATGSIAVDSGATVSTNGKGFSTAAGTGAAGTCSFGACRGGAHAGNGGLGSFGSGGTTAYGSVTQPTTIGSGGGNDTGIVAGLGGGAIKLSAPSGAVTIAGIVTSNGTNGPSAGGGGAGGSVWVDAGALTVSGTVTANGGNGGTASGQSTGGGGGGRLAIYYNTDSGGGTRSAFGGVDGANGTSGGAGSFFVDDKDDGLVNGSLTVDGNNLSNGGNTQQICLPDCVQTYDAITITKGAMYVVNAYTSLILAAGGTLTGGGTQQPDITINAGGAFTPASAAVFTFNDLDVTAAGTINTITDLTVTAATFIESGTGTFAAGVTDLTLNTSTYTKVTGYTGLNLTNLIVPNGSTFNNNSSAYYPFLSTFSTLTVYGTYAQGTTQRFFVDQLIVQNGGTMNHAAQVGGTHSVSVDISATTSIYVYTGGSITTAGRGFPTATGPGAATTCAFGACRGGAHAGDGGLGSFGGGGTTAYGSVTQPTTLGSGGGDDTGVVAGLGGGAIKLVAPSLTVAGTISSNGSNGVSAGGGGAGGSVWIDVDTLTGGGAITANGGNGGTPSGQSTGGGGGGRVAIYYDTDSGTGTRSALSGVDGANGTSGGGGTLFIDDKDDALPNGNLTVDSNNLSNAGNTQQTCLPNCAQTYDNITIRRGARYVINNSTSLTLAAGGTLTNGGTTRPRITVNNGGTFNPGAASFSYQSLDLVVSGSISTVTGLTLNEAGLTLSGTGTFANPVTTLNLNGFSSFTQGSVSPNLALTSLNVPAAGSVLVTANAYYPFGSGFTTLNVTGTYTNSTLLTLFLDALTVNSGGIVTHASNTSTSVKDRTLDISATSSITVASGGSISVTSKGFPASTGTGGKGDCAFSACGGASHAGSGGNGSFGTGSTVIYGSVTQPTTIGSGGGGGGAGGGAVRLMASNGTVTVVGSVTANGGNGPSAGGGGSGGAVLVDAGTLTGGGTFSANGGNAGVPSGQTSGGGGGGRVALYYDTDSGTGTRSAFGGAKTGGGTSGSAGTVFTDDNDDALPNGKLTIDNTNRADDVATTQAAASSQTYDVIDIRSSAEYVIPSGSTLAISSGGTLTGGGTSKGTMTINSGGTFGGGAATTSATGLNITNNGSFATTTSLTYGNGTFTNIGTFTAGLANLVIGIGGNFIHQSTAQLFTGSTLTVGSGGTFTQSSSTTLDITTVTVETGGTLTHCDNSTTHACGVNISSTTFTVQPGGLVGADARGFDSTTGTGQGGDDTAGGGAGHGGIGGIGVVSSVAQGNHGITYSSTTTPDQLGSGGGDDTDIAAQQGGAGGGSVILTVTGTFTMNGDISVDGQNGTANEGGGGSGGSVWLTLGTWTGSGTSTVTANGGTGAGTNTTGGGCGAGGRIYATYTTKTYTGGAPTVNAGTGCTGLRTAQNGSFVEDENEAPAPTITSVSHSPASPTTVDNVSISGSATYSGGVASIKLFLDGTAPANLVHTCSYAPAVTSATCTFSVGQLSRGSHTTTVRATGDDASVAEDSETFSVSGETSGNQPSLSRLKVSVQATFSLTFVLSGTSTGTLTVTFPGGFTVNSAFTSGSSCLSSFGFTASTLTATKTNCNGTVTATGATVTNPASPGVYVITWTNDNGFGAVPIVDDDQVTVSGTVDPFITFNVGTQAAATACDGTFAGNGGTLALGTLTTSSVGSSDVSSVPHICSKVSTNASAGAVVTVRSQNAALQSVGTPADSIPSSTATLSAGTEGYGICVGSGGSDTGRDATTPAGAMPTAASPFNGSCSTSSHSVGGVTTSAQPLWTLSGSSQNAFARIFVKAAISSFTEAHNDYLDVLTFIATATF